MQRWEEGVTGLTCQHRNEEEQSSWDLLSCLGRTVFAAFLDGRDECNLGRQSSAANTSM